MGATEQRWSGPSHRRWKSSINRSTWIAPSRSPHPRFHESPQPMNTVRKSPIVQRRRLIERLRCRPVARPMFNSADAGKAVLVNYTHTISSVGQKFTVANQLLGTTPTCQAVFYTTFQGQAISLRLNNCTSNKLSFHTKLEDFIMNGRCGR
jgi:hypothetical protein